MNGTTLEKDARANVLVICTARDRRDLWIVKLLGHGEVRVYIRDAKQWYEATFAGDNLKFRLMQPLGKVTATILHASDRHLLDAVAKTGKVFWFSEPGLPGTGAGEPFVWRPTSARYFDVTAEDVKEIVDYSLGRRWELPQCCFPKPIIQYLPALSILCQGYLIAHVRPDTGQPEVADSHPAYQDFLKALQALKWAEFFGACSLNEFLLPPHLKDSDKRKELQKRVNEASWWQVCEIDQLRSEWGASHLNEWDKVGRLIKNINCWEISLEAVAQAYCAIHRRLGGQE